MEVVDDGRGFEVDAVPVGQSTGLAGMEERARSTAGRIRATPPSVWGPLLLPTYRRTRGQLAMVIRLVLADVHAIVREGVRALLAADPEFEVVGQAGDGAEVIDLVERLQPDVVVLDLMMPGAGCLDVTRQLARRPDPPAVLILSMHESEAYVVEAMRLGAAGYALKQAPAGEQARYGGLGLFGVDAQAVVERIGHDHPPQWETEPASWTTWISRIFG